MMKRNSILFLMLSVVMVSKANAGKGITSSAITLKTTPDTIQAPTPAQALLSNTANVKTLMIGQAYAAKLIRLNPRAITFVHDYISRNSRDLESLKDWALPYLNMMDRVFTQNDLPTGLKYLSIVESELKSGARSGVGAVGPWQLMPATARALGLKVTKTKDERRDYQKSTVAAAKYLKSLYEEFGDWLLTVAAYNCGSGGVYEAIKKSKSRNFWDLQYFLPAESRNHVKKFISTHYIFEGQGGITTLTKDEAVEQIGALAGYLQNRNLTAEELNNCSTTTISGKYRAVVIAKYVNMDIEDFNHYNPFFDRVIAQKADGSYELKLPKEQMDLFTSYKYPILNESVNMTLENDTNADTDLPGKKTQATAIK